MRTVRKYRMTNPFQLLPAGPVRLVAFESGALPTLWIEVDTEGEQPEARYVVRGTGHSVNINDEHVGSCVSGPFSWHVYRENSNG